VLTLLTFNHCLGRMSEGYSPSYPGSAKNWPRSFDPDLDDEFLTEPILPPMNPARG
jgi:hypothetical protein